MLESADRIGGRAKSETTALGSRVDLGGQWIGHDHHRLMALGDELELTYFKMHTQLAPRIVNGQKKISPFSPSVLMAAFVIAGVGAFSHFKATARWNGATLDRCLRRVPGRTARRLLEVTALVSWTTDLDGISAHAMARQIRAQGGLRTMLTTSGGAQDSLFVEGVGTITDRLADELGDRVLTGQRVVGIEGTERGVTVRTDSDSFEAAKVIVTAPPPIANQIEFDPPLPPGRSGVHRETYMGTVYKAIAIYSEPFWRVRGGGELVTLHAPGGGVFDTTPPDGPGHLCLLVGGSEARALDDLPPAERRERLLGPLVAHLGLEVLEPVSWHERAWHLDEHVGGGYIALPKPGTISGIPPVDVTPAGNIHWAGTESAADHPGYFEGAIDAGERAAREVVEALA